jgi:ribonuclease HI
VSDCGELLEEGGRVEIRYRKNDGRLYRAAARNLTVRDATVLPEDTCGPAQAVQRSRQRGEATARAAEAPQPSTAAPGTVTVYTDGACSSNPGPAGLGVVVDDGHERIELSEYLGEGTNNIAELTAVLRALEQLDETQPALIHTDSQYAIGVLQKGWKAKANAELVAAVRAELACRPNAKLVYVPGHAGVAGNEQADRLARQAIKRCSSARTVTRAGKG